SRLAVFSLMEPAPPASSTPSLHDALPIYSLRHKGRLYAGVQLDNNGMVKVVMNHRSFQKMQETFAEPSNDNRILAVALNYVEEEDRKSTRLNSSHVKISYAVFCLKKKMKR